MIPVVLIPAAIRTNIVVFKRELLVFHRFHWGEEEGICLLLDFGCVLRTSAGSRMGPAPSWLLTSLLGKLGLYHVVSFLTDEEIPSFLLRCGRSAKISRDHRVPDVTSHPKSSVVFDEAIESRAVLELNAALFAV